MFPYPCGRSNVYKAAFCQREKSVVRKKPGCWTCSWCEPGSDAMVSAALEARQCKAVMSGGRNVQSAGSPLPRAT